MSFIVCYACFIFTVSPPPLISGRPRCYRRLHRCRVRLRRRRPYPYRRASRQEEPLTLSHISPTCLFLSVALGICCCYDSVLFQLHILSLSPLDYLSDILCSLYKCIIQQWTLRFASQ